MKRNTILFRGLILAVVLFGATSVSAERTGYYVFAQVGQTDIDKTVGTADRINGDNTSAGIGVGYAFTPMIAVQAGYQNYGKIDATAGCPPDVFCIAGGSTSLVPFSSDKVDIDAISLDVVGTYPLGNLPVSLFGKIGLLRWSTDWRNTPQLDKTENDLLLGAGVQWMPNQSWQLQLGYETAKSDIQTLFGGVAFYF